MQCRTRPSILHCIPDVPTQRTQEPPLEHTSHSATQGRVVSHSPEACPVPDFPRPRIEVDLSYIQLVDQQTFVRDGICIICAHDPSISVVSPGPRAMSVVSIALRSSGALVPRLDVVHSAEASGAQRTNDAEHDRERLFRSRAGERELFDPTISGRVVIAVLGLGGERSADVGCGASTAPGGSTSSMSRSPSGSSAAAILPPAMWRLSRNCRPAWQGV